MRNLYAAFKLADRAYFFDNSKEKTNGSFHFFAEKNGNQLYLSNRNSIPRCTKIYAIIAGDNTKCEWVLHTVFGRGDCFVNFRISFFKVGVDFDYEKRNIEE
jgi:hypothetical protein